MTGVHDNDDGEDDDDDDDQKHADAAHMAFVWVSATCHLVPHHLRHHNSQAACCVGDPTCVDCLTGLLPGLKTEPPRNSGDNHQNGYVGILLAIIMVILIVFP